MLILKLVIEILILWVWFALFMLALVGRKRACRRNYILSEGNAGQSYEKWGLRP